MFHQRLRQMTWGLRDCFKADAERAARSSAMLRSQYEFVPSSEMCASDLSVGSISPSFAMSGIERLVGKYPDLEVGVDHADSAPVAAESFHRAHRVADHCG